MSSKKILSFHDNNFYAKVGKFQTWCQFESMDMAAYHSVFFIFKILEDGGQCMLVVVNIIFYAQ